MSKVDEIKAFVHKNVKVMDELAQAAQHTFYSVLVSDEIIEQQQDLKRNARRLHILSVDTPFWEDAEYRVLIDFDAFSKFISLDECKQKVRTEECATHYHYSIIVENLVLTSIKTVPNEEHKKAQAI